MDGFYEYLKERGMEEWGSLQFYVPLREVRSFPGSHI